LKGGAFLPAFQRLPASVAGPCFSKFSYENENMDALKTTAVGIVVRNMASTSATLSPELQNSWLTRWNIGCVKATRSGVFEFGQYQGFQR
jgi:hypothetical protein